MEWIQHAFRADWPERLVRMSPTEPLSWLLLALMLGMMILLSDGR